MNDSRIEWILANQSSYYEILGVPKSSDEREIRRGYHKLALQIHPDKNRDSKNAAEACRVAIRAYEVLKDKQLRVIYDQHGEEGVKNFEEFGHASFSSIAQLMLLFLLARVLYAAASRAYAVEVVSEKFRWAEKFAPEGSAYEFAKCHKSQRETTRRLVQKFFKFALLLFLCVHAGMFVFRTFGKTSSSAECGPGSYEILDRESSCNRNEVGSTFIHRVKTLGNTTDVTVWRPSRISETHARWLLQRWIRERCPGEQLLAWASRERYEVTATLRVRRVLRAERSPNHALKRRWAPKLWRPKFEESFTVKSSSQLFAPSPLCERLG